ncbi:hypothetical protein Daus18300_012036 [Diaporthe australafricana]|uniref:Major facilitator superfamily (MFS) profile domain-containing protein n=1 Tax=Diaporthe australafricana TaxID=127596 RepID=A0ABR3W4F6_9PEZI
MEKSDPKSGAVDEQDVLESGNATNENPRGPVGDQVTNNGLEKQEMGPQEQHYLPMGPRLCRPWKLTSARLTESKIIAVAIPRITDEFHSLNDVGWYAAAYLLPGCAFQLLFGKLYSLFSVKWVYLTGLVLFEVGTVICGAAPNSTALIVGRAIAGLGSSGLFTGAMMTIAQTVPLEKRPAFMGIIGGVYGLASVIGPLLGGAFTNNVTWRWCFYINLPLGGLTAAGFLLKPSAADKPVAKNQSWGDTVKKMDPVGSVAFVAANVCLLLALQWGGVTYTWSSGRVISLLVVFSVVLVAFVALQLFIEDNATIPTRIAGQRSIAFASLFGICCGGSFFILTYYIPIWFQAIKGDDPVASGIHFLPFILPEIFGIIISGILVTQFGYYNPFFIASSVLMSIAAGLCTTFTADSSQGMWAGY